MKSGSSSRLGFPPLSILVDAAPLLILNVATSLEMHLATPSRRSFRTWSLWSGGVGRRTPKLPADVIGLRLFSLEEEDLGATKNDRLLRRVLQREEGGSGIGALGSSCKPNKLAAFNGIALPSEKEERISTEVRRSIERPRLISDDAVEALEVGRECGLTSTDRGHREVI